MIRLFFKFLQIFLALALIVSVSAVHANVQQNTIKDITVEGTKIIQSAAILNKLSFKKGDLIDMAKIDDDLKKIYKMGFFSDVYFEKSVKDDGVSLRIIVTEKPYIREIKFTGQDDVSEDDLKTQISTKRFSFLDDKKIKEDTARLVKYFQERGFYFVEIKHKVQPTKDKPNDIELLFEIKEGKKIKIDEIIINGVKDFKPGKIQGLMETKEKFWLTSWITDRGIYKADQLKDDFERIKEFYGNEGYIEAKVIGHKVYLNEKKKALIIEIDIFEGKKYTVAIVKVEGDAKDHEAEILPKLKQKKEEVFKRSNIRDDLSVVAEFMGDKGYAYANVEPLLKIDEDKSTIDLSYYVSKGKLVTINRIVIEGNSKTRDNVIRREFKLIEGDLYNAGLIKKSRTKVNRLGFFEEVVFVPQRVEYEKPEKEDEDLMDLLVKVKERPTGFLTFGVGYSSVDYLIGSIQVSQNNLFGRGQKLSASVQASSQSQMYNISFTEPWMFGYPVSGGVDLFKISRKYTDYTMDSYGFGLRSGYRINDEWSVNGGYKYAMSTVSDVEATAADYIKEQLGTTLSSSVYAGVTRDSRNDIFYPTEGSHVSYSIEYAGGILGGDNYFVKSIIDGSKYFLLPWDHTVSLHSQYGIVSGYGGKEVPIYERFFLGGMYSIRGFATRSLGPKDPATGDVLGGSKEIYGNAEYIFPLIKEAGVRGVLFYDIGNAFNTDIMPEEFRQGAGVGIRWYSPIGPLRLEWGKNLAPKEGEPASKWEFSIGTVF